MRNIFPLLLILSLSACTSKINVDLIVHNANIQSVDEVFSVHEAMAILGDEIVEIGPEHQILNKYGAEKIIDAKKQFIYPGFIDAHSHFLGYAKQLEKINLMGCESQDEMHERIQEFSKSHEGDWIEGRGWDQNLWTEKIFPNKDWLDENFPNKFIALKRVDGHAALVNQKVLDLAGINEESQIEGGLIMKIDGKCTGILIDNAVDVITNMIPEIDEARLLDLAKKAEMNCFEKGLTSVCDAGLDMKNVEFLKNSSLNESLKLKFYIMLNPSQENFKKYTKEGIYQTNNVSIRSFKIYADGALGSRGASLLEDYSDDEHNHGLILTPIDSMKSYSKKIYESGFQMNTHAIGDSANRVVARVYAEQLKESNDLRWRIEHAQVVNPIDLSMFREYNIIPSVQPTHATSDMPWAEDRLGPDRIHHAYAYQSLKEQNGMLALGTDFPVESINPLLTLLSGYRRTNVNGDPIGGFLPEEGLSFEDCIRGMTIWAAIANFEDGMKGSLEAGKSADFIILNKDLRNIDASNFYEYSILETFVNGKSVYQKIN